MSGCDCPNGDFSGLAFLCPEVKAGRTASCFSQADTLQSSLQGLITLLHVVHLKQKVRFCESPSPVTDTSSHFSGAFHPTCDFFHSLDDSPVLEHRSKTRQQEIGGGVLSTCSMVKTKVTQLSLSSKIGAFWCELSVHSRMWWLNAPPLLWQDEGAFHFHGPAPSLWGKPLRNSLQGRGLCLEMMEGGHSHTHTHTGGSTAGSWS